MNEIIDFLREYWFQIVTFLGFVIEVIFIFIKRKPKSVDEFLLALNEARANVALLVESVEMPGHGELKKNKVVALSQKFIEGKIGRSLSEREFATFSKMISADIEAVLTAPTKKGV